VPYSAPLDEPIPDPSIVAIATLIYVGATTVAIGIIFKFTGHEPEDNGNGVAIAGTASIAIAAAIINILKVLIFQPPLNFAP